MLFWILAAVSGPVAQPAGIDVTGPWTVVVRAGAYHVGARAVRVAHATTLTVGAPSSVTVVDEKHGPVPVYNAALAPWGRGDRLNALITCETTAMDLLEPESLVVKAEPGSGKPLAVGKEYDVDTRWGSFGRTAAWPADAPMYLDYRAGLHRIDTVAVLKGGAVKLVEGKPHNATPLPPTLPAGAIAIANIWVPGRLARLASENVYLITEPTYPSPAGAGPSAAERMLPKTLAKLRAGEPVHVLAWGDSVTAGGQASDVAHQYQSRFVAMLRQRFPKADIKLTTAGWGGRNSDSFLNEPPGAEFNFDKAVIAPKPDLVVMEFVNDSWMMPDVIEKKYTYLQERLTAAGAEWAILGPHFVWHEWMGAKSVRIEHDPRQYVQGIRAFCKMHNVPLADTGLRWGHLVKEGIPYCTLECNSLNHPDDRGHEMFALALMELFPAK